MGKKVDFVIVLDDGVRKRHYLKRCAKNLFMVEKSSVDGCL